MLSDATDAPQSLDYPILKRNHECKDNLRMLFKTAAQNLLMYKYRWRFPSKNIMSGGKSVFKREESSV
jgi:hypothetical protein